MQQQISDLTAQAQQTVSDISQTNTDAKAKMDGIKAKVDESTKKLDGIYAALDQADNDAVDQLDKLMLQHSQNLSE